MPPHRLPLFATKEGGPRRPLIPLDGVSGQVEAEGAGRLAISELLDREAAAVKRALGDHPWAGKIMSVDGEKVMISAGNDVGVVPGDIFEVFERGEPLRSATGTHIFLLGQKIGEIKVTEVKEEYSAAAPVSTAKLQAGEIIRLKR